MPESTPPPVPEPTNRAGLAPSDPPQGDLTQDADVVIVGDVDELPEV
jgi:hypothetical protein